MSINGVGSNVVTNTDVNMGVSQVGRPKSTPEVTGKKPMPKAKPDIVYPEDRRISQEEAIDAIQRANKEFIAYDRRFEFSIHEKTKQIMVKVIDATNDEVIRELPPEKILDMVAAMWEVAGILVDRKI